ncbi:hypothetical protein MIZ03_3697 [Rhodoferax lithotrophicus]|uniref:Uncharacterized protein n=1 Tax=Rhodoferax lithotrophicus TaxID=2798804 RepID=A0ABM7MQZ3_9BURK|nr:hypothetical protein MIZ03_3697 [Rhodoferax sp. MIZ03]
MMGAACPEVGRASNGKIQRIVRVCMIRRLIPMDLTTPKPSPV